MNHETQTIALAHLASIQSGYPALARTQIDTLTPHHFLQAGDVLLRSRGATNPAMVLADPPPKTLSPKQFMRIRIHDQATLLPAYLGWFLNTTPAQLALAQYVPIGHRRTLRLATLHQLEVPLPDITKQQRIIQSVVC
jgi:restriction endonuclease S subunit